MLFLMMSLRSSSYFFFFNDTATTEIYTLSLHDALPIYSQSTISAIQTLACIQEESGTLVQRSTRKQESTHWPRSEEHTSELQSQSNLVCRLLLEKKKKTHTQHISI